MIGCYVCGHPTNSKFCSVRCYDRAVIGHCEYCKRIFLGRGESVCGECVMIEKKPRSPIGQRFCKVCGVPVSQEYCSSTCRNKARLEERDCVGCGIIFLADSYNKYQTRCKTCRKRVTLCHCIQQLNSEKKTDV